MAKSSETLDPEPVDAEFEPASDAAEAPGPSSGSRSNWAGTAIMFVAASLTGAALGYAAMRYAPAPGSAEESPGLQSEQAEALAAIETRISALEQASSDRVSTSDLVALDTRVDALEQTDPPAASVDLSVIETRLADLETGASNTPAAANGEVDLSPLMDRLDAVETGLADQQAALDQYLDAAQAESATPPIDPGILENLSQRLSALEAEMDAWPDAVSDMSDSVTALEAHIAGLETGLSETRALADAARSTADAAAQSAADRPEDDGQAARQLAARALALTALRDRAATGSAFEAERAALARLWRGNDDLTALAAFSRSGAPALDALTEGFPAVAIRDAAGSGRHFFGLLQVRRVDPAEDENDPLAIAALAEIRLAEGDLEAAVLLTEQLDGETLDAAQDWLLGARARLETDTRLAALRQSLAADAAEQGADPS